MWSSMVLAYFKTKNAGNLFLFNATIYCYYWPFILFVLIVTSNVVSATHQTGLQRSDAPTHLNFFRSALRGRQRVLSCANDPSVCLDREKNPWGGTTCCFQKFCKDTMRDRNHCGACGLACAYGLLCCDGKCIDVQNDPQHCGSCFEVCPGQPRCSYSMCDYGGWLINKNLISIHFPVALIMFYLKIFLFFLAYVTYGQAYILFSSVKWK